MQRSYFEHVRREIAPLLPPAVTRIVDVGCGTGATTAWLKQRYPAAHTIGLEGNPALRGALASHVDEAHIVDLNGALPDLGAPDLILCLDVLEHLAAPEAVLQGLASSLQPGGTVIVSLPNIAHVSVSAPLFFQGRFEYRDSGILDRTHTRFFVRRSAVALLNSAQLVVEKGIEAGVENPKSRMIDRLTLGLFREQLTRQYVLSGQRMADGCSQGAISWSTA